MVLNVNDLNSPNKRYRQADWMKKQDPTIWYIQETRLSYKDKHKLKVKVWKMTFQSNGIYKQTGVATLIPPKTDFKPKLVKK